MTVSDSPILPKRPHPFDAPLHHIHRWLPNLLFSGSSPASLRNPHAPAVVDPAYLPDLQQSDFAHDVCSKIAAYQQARPELTYAQVLVRLFVWRYLLCVLLVSIETGFMIGQVQLLLKILTFIQNDALGLDVDKKSAYVSAMGLALLTFMYVPRCLCLSTRSMH